MKVLKKGDKGRDVAELQQALAGLGYQPEDAAWQTEAGDAGVFGEQTAKAVNRFRAGFGWDPYGQATVNTRRAIQAEVAALQRKLAALGLYQGAVHGRFDDATRQALAAFQTASLPGRTAAGGCLDPATRAALADLPPYTFDEVLGAELDAVNHGRAAIGLNPEQEAAASGNALVRAHQARLLGLALSGGGIRSATFNLGVLQGLARLGLLRRVDYLSTVSGGGYIGAWLHAWVKRDDGGIRAVEDKLAVPDGAARHEPGQLSWLRQYSNYLTPRVGLLSADTMAGVATWLRNVLLNQAILGALGLAVLCLPWALFMLPGRSGWTVPASVAGGVALLLAMSMSLREIADIQRAAAPGTGRSGPPARAARRRVVAVIAGTALAALLLGLALPIAAPSDADGRMLRVVLGPPAVLLALLLLATVAVGLAGRRLREATREWCSRAGGLLISLLLGWLALAGVALLGGYGMLLAGAWIAAMGGVAWLATTVAGVAMGGGAAAGKGWKKAVVGVAPWVFVAGLLVVLSVTLHAAIVKMGGAAATPVCQAVAAAGPAPAYRVEMQFAGGAASGEVTRLRAQPGCDLARYAGEAEQALAAAWVHFLSLFACLVLMAWLLGWRVDINVFAFHMFYRNRLERCYMGASNPQRRPQPFTGLDSHDSPRLDELEQDGHVQRPYPLINTALNISRSDNLAWQERKAASFVFSPAYCGYQLPGGADVAAYQKTADYLAAMPAQRRGWLALGTPVTISGAAASPNAGYHTHPATAFLMTVFNVRLGWWMQNTRRLEQWRQGGPRLSLRYLLKELLADTRDSDDFVYLSDGGHFENLGLYELVRRRCRYVVVCDAGCDPDYHFEDLGNAIRKCRIDLGIEIDIDPGAIVPDPATGRSQFHCAVGTIHYERRDPVATPGYLLYVKASLTGNESTDVRQYKAEHAAFPHESTGDQWYSESQFESYRRLGLHVVMQALAQAREAAGGDRACDLEGLFHALSERWFPPSLAGREAFSKHGAELEKIYDRLRLDGNLRFLDAQIYPEWRRMVEYIEEAGQPDRPAMLPNSEDELRAGFYLCNALIQLMENVYLDLRLEEEHGHPDNRGWMNQFRHWSWSGMFRVTWAVSVSTYGARFQQFCRRHLGLESGGLVLSEAVEVGAEGWQGRLNFVEQDHVRRLIAGHFAGTADDLAGLDRTALVEVTDRWLAGAGRGRLELQVMEVRVADPSGKERTFAFQVGFALLDKARDSKAERGLVYYRVQDHLRRMGLGRAGLARLQEAWPALYVDMPAGLVRLIPEAAPGLLQNLWHMVRWSRAAEQETGGA